MAMFCGNSCGRESKDGHRTCCMKCELSDGQRHGPRCDVMAAALAEGQRPQNLVWQVRLSSEWTKLTNNKKNEQCIIEAEAAGEDQVTIYERGFTYCIDFLHMTQTNTSSGRSLHIRLADWVDDWEPIVVPPRPPRLQNLVEFLLSSAVQVPQTLEMTQVNEESERLTKDEVRKVFIDHVPGVNSFLYRGMARSPSLPMIIDAYFAGIPAFHGTSIDRHMLSLFRVVVHHGYDCKPRASHYLREVAEAFMDCMAVQGRVVQRAAMEILGVSTDFRGLVTRLVGYQKDIAIKMLAVEHARQGIASDDQNKPTHYESRLINDLGNLLGLNCDDIRQALFDRQMGRFPQLTDDALHDAASRCRELFDLSSLLQALVAEFNSFSSESKSGSLAGEFVSWAAANLQEPHIIFSAEDPHRVFVSEPLALACLESLFFGKISASPEEKHQGRYVIELFGSCVKETENAVQPHNAYLRLALFRDWTSMVIGFKSFLSSPMIYFTIGFLSYAISLMVVRRED